MYLEAVFAVRNDIVLAATLVLMTVSSLGRNLALLVALLEVGAQVAEARLEYASLRALLQ